VKIGVGSKVIYPTYGPCLIAVVVEKEIAGLPVRFYRTAKATRAAARERRADESPARLPRIS
jgi:RNA polymerase-interacting CarD/CdnL/TRCF family regulator